MAETIRTCEWSPDKQGYHKTECGYFFHSGQVWCSSWLPDICPYCHKRVMRSTFDDKEDEKCLTTT